MRATLAIVTLCASPRLVQESFRETGMVRFRFDTIGINDAIFMVPGAHVAASNLGILSPGWDFGWVSHDLGDFAGGTRWDEGFGT